MTAPALARLWTRRLCLERAGPAHQTSWAALHADPRVMATLGGVRDDAATAAMLAAQDAHWRAHGFGYWTLLDAASGAFVGRAGLRRVHVGGGDEVELGYAIAADRQRRGLATEAARAALEVAFEQLGLSELVAFTLPDNVASRAVMRRVGFRYERDVEWSDLPHVLYRLPRDAWAGPCVLRPAPAS